MQNHDVSDKELIAGYLKGNEKSFQKLLHRHKQKVFTSILIMVKNRELAEDLFQDTFIKVINTLRAGRYKEQGKFSAWVIRIAHNVVMDHFRINNRMFMIRDTEEYSVMDKLHLMDGSNIEDYMMKEGNNKQVRLLLEQLPFEQREVVIMRHYGDMSFKEIAKCTNVNINTALARMRYALINMRILIKKKNIEL